MTQLHLFWEKGKNPFLFSTGSPININMIKGIIKLIPSSLSVAGSQVPMRERVCVWCFDEDVCLVEYGTRFGKSATSPILQITIHLKLKFDLDICAWRFLWTLKQIIFLLSFWYTFCTTAYEAEITYQAHAPGVYVTITIDSVLLLSARPPP